VIPNSTRFKVLHKAQQIAVGVLYQKLGLAMFQITVAIPIGCEGLEKRQAKLNQPIMKRDDIGHFDLKVDAAPEGCPEKACAP
jgi:hypothetical protein